MSVRALSCRRLDPLVAGERDAIAFTSGRQPHQSRPRSSHSVPDDPPESGGTPATPQELETFVLYCR
jgi:hypothetical protein